MLNRYVSFLGDDLGGCLRSGSTHSILGSRPFGNVGKDTTSESFCCGSNSGDIGINEVCLVDIFCPSALVLLPPWQGAQVEN